MSRTMNFVAGLIGTALFFTFIIGLVTSVSTGFAGFWGGLPLMIITLIVLLMATYDFWEACIRKKQ